jgi:hypothetical protein
VILVESAGSFGQKRVFGGVMSKLTSRGIHRLMWAGGMAMLCLCVGGCQVWNGWLDMLKWKGADAKKSEVFTPNDTANGAAALPTRMIVYKITLPVGTFSTNDKVWAQLNEDGLDSKTNVLLAQNGLRAATGPIARWETLGKIIDVPGATTDQMVCQTDGHSTLNVVTRSNISDQIVVSIDRDLQQQGRTFEHCDNGFRLTMRKVRALKKDDKALPQLMVELEPVVTQGSAALMQRSPSLTLNSGGGAFTSEEEFSDLQMGATLAADQFLVVSPQDPKESRFSVGSLWLSNPDHVPATETVLVFIPAIGETTAAKK